MDIRTTSSINKILLAAGWYEKRAIDVRNIYDFLTSEGFVWGSTIETFLREFGNLSYSFVDKDFQRQIFHFSPLVALAGIHKGWVLNDYAPRVNKDLCIIGQARNGYMTLSMAKDGSVYGGYDDFLCYIGENGEKAIENLVNEVDLVEID